MALTPQSPHHGLARLLTLLVLVAVFGSACSATPSWISSESAAASTESGPASNDTVVIEREAPEALAMVEQDTPGSDTTDADTEPEPPAPSDEFCLASANIWIHSAALNLVAAQADDEVTQIAMANVAEWIERSTLFDEPAGPDHTDMFTAFTSLQETVATNFDFDWMALQTSSAYADSGAAQTYEVARSELVSFLNDNCDDQTMSTLRDDAEARADELRANFGAAPSTVVESDSLPGHSIFTHTSGRMIASFPTAWDYEERTDSVIVELIASPNIEQFLAGEAIDGIHLQLVEADSVDDFRLLLDATATGSSCERTTDLLDSTTVRQNITQMFSCGDHGASIVGQYNEGRSLGLIIEASFDRVDASRSDLIRLASIANSALWS